MFYILHTLDLEKKKYFERNMVTLIDLNFKIKRISNELFGINELNNEIYQKILIFIQE